MTVLPAGIGCCCRKRPVEKSCTRNCSESKDCIIDAKRRSWSLEGAKADLRIEDLLELAVCAGNDEVLETAVALDFLPILIF